MDALGLGAAKAHKEEERRKAEDKRRQDKKEAQRKLELETVAATAAITHQAAQLHEGLQGIRGTELEKRVQKVEASDATNCLVLAIVKEVRTIRQFARSLNRDISVSRTSWHKGVILGRNGVFGVFHL